MIKHTPGLFDDHSGPGTMLISTDGFLRFVDVRRKAMIREADEMPLIIIEAFGKTAKAVPAA